MDNVFKILVLENSKYPTFIYCELCANDILINTNRLSEIVKEIEEHTKLNHREN